MRDVHQLQVPGSTLQIAVGAGRVFHCGAAGRVQQLQVPGGTLQITMRCVSGLLPSTDHWLRGR